MKGNIQLMVGNRPRNTAARKAKAAALLVILFTLWVPSCNRTPPTDEEGPKYGTAPLLQNLQTYAFAVHPLHNPSKLNEAYYPLIHHLNGLFKDVRFNLEASRNYSDFETKFQARKPAFLLPNPWQTLKAMKAGYTVIAMAGEPGDFKGIFLTRRDSGIEKPADLKGKAVSCPSPTALAACVMPQYFLQSHGIDVNTEIDNRYVGSQESSIMNAYLKQTAVAATWPPPWRAFQKDHPKESSEMRLLWETSALVNNSVMAKNDVPDSVREQVREALLKLPDTLEGRAILEGMETARFLSATDADYDVVRDYVARFEKDVHSVEQK